MEKLTENMIRFEERNKMIIQDFEPKHIEETRKRKSIGGIRRGERR